MKPRLLNVASLVARACRALVVVGLALAIWPEKVAGQTRRQNANLPAQVTFSDGTTASGTLRIMGSRPLILTPLGGSQRIVSAEDILSLEQIVESASLERPWTFKEAGKPEKIYFEGAYPLLNFRTRAILTTGEVVEGHAISAVYQLTRDDGGRDKIFLRRQIKGEVGQPLEAVVYPASIRYPDNAPVAGERLHGRLVGAGGLLAASAIDLRRQHVLRATIDGDRFDFGILLPGLYDLCLLSDRIVVAGLSETTPDAYGRGEDLTDTDRRAIDETFPLADDFFNDRWILAATGHRAYARTLVYKRRADYHDAHVFTPGGWAWHLDVWNWYRPGDEWKLESRHIFLRHLQSANETTRRLYLADELGAVAPDANPLELNYETDSPQWRALRLLD